MTNSSLLSLIGYVFAVRTIGQNYSKKNFSRKETSAFVIFLSLLFLFSALNCQKSFLAQVMTSFILFISVPAAVFIKKKIQLKRLEVEIVNIYDQIILQMQMGRAFAEALNSVLVTSPAYGNWIREIFLNKQYQGKSRQTHRQSKIERVSGELYEVSQSSFKTIDRLKAYRSAHAIEIKFKNKALQATLQTKIQAIFITFMYFGLFISKFAANFDANWPIGIEILSGVLFFAGIYLIWNTGRGYQWKV